MRDLSPRAIRFDAIVLANIRIQSPGTRYDSLSLSLIIARIQRITSNIIQQLIRPSIKSHFVIKASSARLRAARILNYYARVDLPIGLGRDRRNFLLAFTSVVPNPATEEENATHTRSRT